MGFFLFFMKIPVWLVCYAHVFHVYIVHIPILEQVHVYTCTSVQYMVLVCIIGERERANLVVQLARDFPMYPTIQFGPVY